MATPKADRAPPSRTFENYILTYEVGDNEGPVPILSKNMSLFTDDDPSLVIPPLRGINLGGSIGDLSDLTDIGFDFVFNEVTYRRFVATTDGWIALARSDATTPVEPVQDLLLSGTNGIAVNENIDMNGSSESVLICPWYDGLRSVYDDVDLVQGFGMTLAIREQISFGLAATPPPNLNKDNWGVRFFREDSPTGRRIIIRWDTQLDYGNDGPAVKFDCVLYENGKIEFRYGSRDRGGASNDYVVNGTTDAATIGVFLNEPNTFRDFAPVLGYKTEFRESYVYGGAVYQASWSDSTSLGEKPYAVGVDSQRYWPANRFQGATITFQPPMLRRRILPRKETAKEASRTRRSSGAFNDRRTLNFLTGSRLLNFPTTLTRFFDQGIPGVTDRQDLYVHDMLLPGNIVRSAIDQHLLDDSSGGIITAFNESSRSEQDATALEDPFFVSGSVIELPQSMRSKTQIKFSLPINLTTRMLESTSGMYYYNSKLKRWQIPVQTFNNGAGSGGDVVISDKLASYANLGTIFDDHRGFGPIGNMMVSGAYGTLGRRRSSSLLFAGEEFSFHGWELNEKSWFRALSQTVDGNHGVGANLVSDFQNSVTINEDYRATDDETFSIPFDYPFVIEKAVIEIPFECGSGWFDDITRTFQPITDNAGTGINGEPFSDFAGPAITVGLFNQLTEGDKTRRELILSGVITHANDMTSSLVIANDQPLSATFLLRPEGFPSYASQPAAVIVPNAINQFTGSARLKTEAAISNGVTVLVRQNFNKLISDPPVPNDPPDSVENRRELLNLMRQESLQLTSSNNGYYTFTNYNRTLNIAYTNPYGRSTPKEPLGISGRSVFGKECGGYQGAQEGQITNPFHVATSSLQANAQFVEAIDNGGEFRARAMVHLATHYRSPYVIHPGDKLVLSVSKTRPVFYSTFGTPDQPLSGSNHDVKLVSGDINITFYGSLLREGEEFHEVTQPLTSDAMHDVIGCEPVLDQFDVSSRYELSGSYVDEMITGSLVSRVSNFNKKNKLTTFVTGSRARVASMVNPRDYLDADTISKSFNLQPIFERTGTSRTVSHVNTTERYWDSLVPNLSDMFVADGVELFKDVAKDTSFRKGSIWAALNLPPGPTYTTAYSGFSNDNIAYAYPFEPRYAHIARQLDFTAGSMIVKTDYNGGSPIAIDPVNGVSLIVITHQYVRQPSFINRLGVGSPNVVIAIDVNTITEVSGGLSLNDTLRYMYGFGDNNSIFFNASQQAGNTNLPEFRDINPMHGTVIYNHPFAPVIRGWKYGVHNGLPEFSKAHFNRNHYGHFRDMFEQRPMAKYFTLDSPNNPPGGVGAAVVNVRFMGTNGSLTSPENTASSNLSTEATSSFPYLDGVVRNRGEINTAQLGATVLDVSGDNL